MKKYVNGNLVDMTQAEITTLPPAKTQAEREAEKEAERRRAIEGGLEDDWSVTKVLLKISFLQENKIRALEGKQPVTAEQFRAWVENQIE